MQITEKDAIRGFAMFLPNAEDQYGNQILDHLILEALATIPPSTFSNPFEIKNLIRQLFKINYEEEEILGAAKRLKRKGRVNITYPHNRTEKPNIQIEEETAQKVSENVVSVRALEAEVFDLWRSQLKSKYGIDHGRKDKIESIIDGLKMFLGKLSIIHGKEAVSILYPDNQKAKNWVSSIKDSVLSSIDSIEDSVKAYLYVEIPSFFENADSSRRLYINNLFNSSFLWHLIQIDEQCSNLVRNVTSGQTLILDNNILYNLIGLDGKEMLRSIHALLGIAAKLGYKLAVTAKTIEEFHESLDFHLKKLHQKPPYPRELAKVAAEVLKADSVISVYWDEFAQTGISIEEFISEKILLDPILEKLSIRVINKYHRDIDESEELTEEMAILSRFCPEHTNDFVIEHDAFHKILIKKLRKGEKFKFSDAKFWFLTNDTKLPRYAIESSRGRTGRIPFCITTSQFVQTNRPLLARTNNSEEFEESFHHLVTRPYLRTMLQHFQFTKISERVLDRLARYDDLDPKFAFKIATNHLFLKQISPDSSVEIIDDKIQHELSDIADSLREEKKEIERKLNAESKKRLEVEKENRAKEEENRLLKTRVENLDKEVANIGSSIEVLTEKKRRGDLDREKLENALWKERYKRYSDNHINKIASEAGRKFENYRRKMPQRIILFLFCTVVIITLFVLSEDLDLTSVQSFFGLSEGVAKSIKGGLAFLLAIIPGVIFNSNRNQYWAYLFKYSHFEERMKEEYLNEIKKNRPTLSYEEFKESDIAT